MQLNIKKKLKGPNVDWGKFNWVTKNKRPISSAKRDDIVKMLPLISPASRQYYIELLELPVQNIADDVDLFEEIEEEFNEN